ncbi:unnamed protein product [Cuscuta epithymum]|uniref:Uncharacterized protein n=1 Tax=Cuscuta epithymum TaxID=186058 RepID=A0AAV0F8U5_9ASTE|nr:unnamed protein product [Cuscuta epithymum]
MLDENSAEYDPQSQKFNLVPGDTIIALGRYNGEQNGLMVIAGEFSINLTGLDCPELFRAEFEIVRHGIGGPIINRYGEVIGITFYCASLTPFLPINLISLWWEQFKNKGHCLLPRLGMELSNLYLWDIAFLESVIKRFPNVFQGVVVEEIESNGSSTALSENDVFIECDGKPVQNVLEFF